MKRTADGAPDADRQSPLRILELRSVFGTGGGPEKTILLGAAQADPARYRVTVCYIRDRRDPVFHIDDRARRLGIDYVEVHERHSADPAVWGHLRRLIRHRDIDIVHAHDYKTNVLALALGRYESITPLATAHGWTGHSRRERWIYYPADRAILARYPRVIAVSSEIRDALVRAGAREASTTVVLNGIDPSRFVRHPDRREAARRLYGLAPDDIVVGAVGRLEPQKNFDLLIRTFAAVNAQRPRARLVIAGDGGLRAILDRQITDAGLTDRCRLVGHIGDVGTFHDALDLFVQSSDYEGTPNAVLEAMALETPIVATDAGGTAELARDGKEAVIVPCMDEAALTRALIEALTDTAAAARRARAARHRVEGPLSFASRMKQVEGIYDELGARMQRRPPAEAAVIVKPCETI